MSDFVFVLKCMAFTLILGFLMQIKILGVSVEARAESLLRNSEINNYLQDASVGGARLIQEGYYSTKNFVIDSTRSFRSSESYENKASKQ